MADLDISTWIDKLTGKLMDVFGERLRFVGVQGSRARGEAGPTSDIDAVVIIEALDASDIAAYRTIVATMPESSLACGFIGSPDALAAWCRHDAFNLVMDTKAVFGSLDFMDTEFTVEDVLLSAKAGASEIYHALAHTLAFEPDALSDVVKACVKSSFFVMCSLQFAKTGEYPSSRVRMRELASPIERQLLDAYGATADERAEDRASALLTWSESIICKPHA